MASFNKVIICGNIANEIELKQTTSGVSVCSFSIAVNRFSKDTNESKADFFTAVAWREKAEFISRCFSKGKPILVCGKLENRSYTDKGGNNRIVTEIIVEEVSFIGSASESPKKAENTAPATVPYMPPAYGGNNAPQFEAVPNDGDLPF